MKRGNLALPAQPFLFNHRGQRACRTLCITETKGPRRYFLGITNDEGKTEHARAVRRVVKYRPRFDPSHPCNSQENITLSGEKMMITNGNWAEPHFHNRVNRDLIITYIDMLRNVTI